MSQIYKKNVERLKSQGFTLKNLSVTGNFFGSSKKLVVLYNDTIVSSQSSQYRLIMTMMKDYQFLSNPPIHFPDAGYP